MVTDPKHYQHKIKNKNEMLPDHLIERITIDAARLEHREKYEPTLEIIKNMVQHYFHNVHHSRCTRIRGYAFPSLTTRRWINIGQKIPSYCSYDFMVGSVPKLTKITTFCTVCGEYKTIGNRPYSSPW